MIEINENALQLAVLIACAVCAVVNFVRLRNQGWVFLALAYSGFALGDGYWLACLLAYGKTPQISAVSDLSWYTFHLFVYLLLKQVLPEKLSARSPLSWAGPVFAAAAAVFFMRWGSYLSNVVSAVLMGILLYQAIGGLLVLRKHPKDRRRFLYLVTLVFCLLNYALWISSCFWDVGTLSSPYYWLDFMMTLCFPLFLPATGKAVSAP